MIASAEIEAKTAIQHEMRRIFRDTDTFEGTCTMLMNEGIELTETVVECEIGQSATPLAFELGDIFIVWNRVKELSRKQHKEIPSDAQGVFDYAMEICERTGIEPTDAIRVKLIRNSMKYEMFHSNEDWSYQEAARVMRKMWSMLGGDENFSQMYEMMGDEL